MKVIIAADYDELSLSAARIVAAEIAKRPNPVLGLATGSTPEGMYRLLVDLYSSGKLDFSSVTSFNLDEYASLDHAHPQSYHCYMRRHLFDHINIRPEKINLPGCDELDPEGFCRSYDARIEASGGIDIQVLGIGVNGHIGFNEPAGVLKQKTHLVDLSPETILANSRFFASPEEVPRQAVTMGIGSIMHSKKILLLASGSQKAPAVAQTVSGLISTRLPASVLQLHRDSTLLIDRDAAAGLQISYNNPGSFRYSGI